MTGSRGPISKKDLVTSIADAPSKRAAARKAAAKKTATLPTPPAFLNAEGKAEWRRVTKALDAEGLIELQDRAVLAMYCDAWSKFVGAQQLLKVGLVHKTGYGRGPAKNPAWQIYREAAALALTMAKDLLCTPNARLRAQLPGAADGDEGDGVLD